MTVRLRGHHLLCLLGYRGMGYSPEYVANMTAVHERLRREPQTPVALVDGPDDLCACFPRDRESHCERAGVGSRDETVLARLGLRTGEVRTWEEIERRIAGRVVPSDIAHWCVTCPWRPYGVCEEGVSRANRGLPLAPLPDEK
jgi:hypothetical protein